MTLNVLLALHTILLLVLVYVLVYIATDDIASLSLLAIVVLLVGFTVTWTLVLVRLHSLHLWHVV
jgi:hypothetical protein